MKKAAAMIFALMFIFSACEKEPENLPENLPENSVSEESSSEYEYADNKELLGEIDDFEIYADFYTEGSRNGLEFDSINTPTLEKYPNRECFIIDSEGNLLIEQPFDYCELFAPVSRYSHPDYYTLSGSHDGNLYKFIYKDGKFEEWIYEPAGETGDEFFGDYKLTRYCWNTDYFYYGINDSEGNVVFEPIYAKIEMSFEDRFILYLGGPGMFNNSGEGKCRIVNSENYKFAEYNYVTYKFFDDDSYIGIANVAGGGVKCFDENGKIVKNGYYFVDKNGKIISERFLSLEANGGNIFAASSPEDVITGTDKNGTPIEFKLGDYAIKSGYEFLGMAEDTAVFCKTVKTGGTRKDIIPGKDGELNEITKVPEIEYWITDVKGNKLIDHPFYDYIFWEPFDGIYGGTAGIRGAYKGDYYRYSFENGKFILAEMEKAGAVERWPFYNDSKIFDDFVPTIYYYGMNDYEYGLNDKNGNVIFEPIFTYIPYFPFEDRIIVTTNNRDRMDGWEAFTTLMDLDKNIICTYTSIDFYYFEDGSYIGIARYGGYGENWGHILRDENGDILETGHRFIDKDGNVLSPCFDLFSLCGNEDEFIEEYMDKTAFFTDKDGNEIKITLKDYIITP